MISICPTFAVAVLSKRLIKEFPVSLVGLLSISKVIPFPSTVNSSPFLRLMPGIFLRMSMAFIPAFASPFTLTIVLSICCSKNGLLPKIVISFNCVDCFFRMINKVSACWILSSIGVYRFDKYLIDN